jgi:hypothetical protein
MRILPLVLLIPVLGAVSTAFGATENCVPDTGCPEDQEPLVDCCQEPKCEFWNALEEARASKIIVSNARFSHTPAEGDTSQQDYEGFSKQVREEIRKIRKKFPKCETKGKPRNPPIFSVDTARQDCRIMTYVDKSFQQLGLPDAQTKLDGCAELAEAKYESAYVATTYCELQATSPADRMNERQERANREMTVLEDQLIRYWRACTISPDFEPADIILKNSVDVLKRFNYNNKWSAPPARRAGR